MKCRTHCGACCIAPSIVTPYYGMPKGKAAGEPCTHLDMESKHCKIWGSEHYPKTCEQFTANIECCGVNAEEAIKILDQWEVSTRPNHTL